MKHTLLTLTLLSTLALASAQEKLSREETLRYAFVVAGDLKQLQATPIPTDVDVKQPVAIRDGDFGGMVLPEAKLSADAIAKAGEKVVPIGQLWLLKLTPMQDGEAVAASKLRMVTLSHRRRPGEGRAVRPGRSTEWFGRPGIVGVWKGQGARGQGPAQDHATPNRTCP